MDTHGNIGEGYVDWGSGFVDGDVDGAHRKFVKDALSDIFREGLDQVARLASDKRVDPFGKIPVVHGAGQVVADCGGLEIEVQEDIDDELLTVRAFVLKYSVESCGGYTGDGDSVGSLRRPLLDVQRAPNQPTRPRP